MNVLIRHGPFDILGGGGGLLGIFFGAKNFLFGQFWRKIIFFAGPLDRIIFL